MKKLKMELDGIGELLSKEQMKMVSGGSDYEVGYVQCNWEANYYVYEVYQGRVELVWGYHDAQVSDCNTYCSNHPFTNLHNASWDNHLLVNCSFSPY